VAEVTTENVREIFRQKYGASEQLGWGPRQRLKLGYFTPDDVYEAAVSRLVTPETVWLDVGCGRDLFPGSSTLAHALAKRCRRLVGLDPSDNIDENPYVHERFKTTIDGFTERQRFDLITLRMVAEHIPDPDQAVVALSNIAKPGGRVVIFTVYRWSPVTLVSSLIPFGLHHKVKTIFWRTEDRDTFPTAYRMNTRRGLRRWFEAEFEEEGFSYVDDCRTLARWKALSTVELYLWKVLHLCGLHYPEVCLLGIYRRRPVESEAP
jgi:2-polyprenyl-3-methyl-5-hydroxy-6-metoxy-1,4-benzoquinol methylase